MVERESKAVSLGYFYEFPLSRSFTSETLGSNGLIAWKEVKKDKFN